MLTNGRRVREDRHGLEIEYCAGGRRNGIEGEAGMRSKRSVTCGRDRRSADVLEMRDEICAARDEESGLRSNCDGGLQWSSSERNIILISKRGFSEAFHTASLAYWPLPI